MAKKVKKTKLLQTKKAMREELSYLGNDCEMISQISGVSLDKIKKFCQTGEISDNDLLKLDKVNRM
jgi:ribosomal protein S8